MIELKNFTLTQHPPEKQYPDGMIWIENQDGEGMGVQLPKFEELIAAYFAENF